jgi:hypothetical protein
LLNFVERRLPEVRATTSPHSLHYPRCLPARVVNLDVHNAGAACAGCEPDANSQIPHRYSHSSSFASLGGLSHYPSARFAPAARSSGCKGLRWQSWSGNKVSLIAPLPSRARPRMHGPGAFGSETRPVKKAGRYNGVLAALVTPGNPSTAGEPDMYTFRAIFSGAYECYRWGCPAAARPPGSPWGRQARYKRAFHEGVFEKRSPGTGAPNHPATVAG